MLKHTILFAAVAGLVLAAMAGTAQAAPGVDTFTNVSALQWDTGNTASSKTVHFVGANTGVGFDVTLATDMGNLLTGTYKPGGISHLADSGGINGKDWFEGTLTVTVGNFSGASLGDITFQLVDVSGLSLVMETILLTSTATIPTKEIPTVINQPFNNLGLDSSAANMAGGSYVATLVFEDIDPETSALYKSLSFEVTAIPEPATLALLGLGGLGLILGRKRK